MALGITGVVGTILAALLAVLKAAVLGWSVGICAGWGTVASGCVALAVLGSLWRVALLVVGGGLVVVLALGWVALLLTTGRASGVIWRVLVVRV